jgi:hypothetical protein
MNTNLLRNTVVSSVLLCLSLAAIACGPNVRGKYSAVGGAFVLELQFGGKANLTVAGKSDPCTYKVNGKSLSLTCEGQSGAVVFTIQDDGSLAGPPGSFIPPMQKAK